MSTSILVSGFSLLNPYGCSCQSADLVSGALDAVQVHKFSKFIHGTATLLPDMIAAVPYWIDDESVRPSMLQSAGYRDSSHQAE